MAAVPASRVTAAPRHARVRRRPENAQVAPEADAAVAGPRRMRGAAVRRQMEERERSSALVELSQQHWSAARYAATAHFVPAYGAPVVELLAPQPGERILDLGCGAGVLTEAMVAAARARGLDARVVPGQSLAFEREFDAVFSNAALHWMRPQEAVLAGVRRALKPGGRFVAEMGGHNNTAAIQTAMRAVLARRGIETLGLSPWYFPSAEAYRAKLEAAGFAVDEIALIPRPTPMPAGLDAWLETFADDFLNPLPPEERPAARREICDLLQPFLRDETGMWIADYVRLRFRARAA